MFLAKNLRYLRLQNNLSQDDIANKLEYKSFTTVQKWESGIAEPSVDKIQRLADMYNVSVNDLLNRDLEVDGLSFSSETVFFKNAQDALEFIIRQPLVAQYGGYDLDTMNDEEIIEMANDVADMLQIMAKKQRKKDNVSRRIG